MASKNVWIAKASYLAARGSMLAISRTLAALAYPAGDTTKPCRCDEACRMLDFLKYSWFEFRPEGHMCVTFCAQ